MKKVYARLSKLRELVEHEGTPDKERLTALHRIRELKKKYGLDTAYMAASQRRPRKPPEQRRDHVIKVLVTGAAKARLRAEAEKEGKSLSDFCYGILTASRTLQD